MATKRTGRVTIIKDKDGKVSVRYQAGNNRITADTQGYKTIQGALKGIQSTINDLKKPLIIDKTLKPVPPKPKKKR